jgi:hypothetical protein
VFHFTPTSASWLNAVEGFFSTITRRRIRRGVFKSVPDLEHAIAAYIREHNKTANPFLWTKPADVILAKLTRLPRFNVINDNTKRSGGGHAAQRGDRSVDGVKNATRATMAWYVSYRTGGTTVMHILRSRELAINAACRLFDWGYYDTLEVGPMLGPREGTVLDQRDIRRIQETRTSRPTAVAKPERRRSFWGASVG